MGVNFSEMLNGIARANIERPGDAELPGHPRDQLVDWMLRGSGAQRRPRRIRHKAMR
jgi:hypothetical protein